MQQSRAIRVETKKKSRIKFYDKARNGKCRLRTTNIKQAQACMFKAGMNEKYQKQAQSIEK